MERKTIEIKLTKGLETQLIISGMIDKRGKILYDRKECYMNPNFMLDGVSHVVPQESTLQEAYKRIEIFAESRYPSKKTKLKIKIQ